MNTRKRHSSPAIAFAIALLGIILIPTTAFADGKTLTDEQDVLLDTCLAKIEILPSSLRTGTKKIRRCIKKENGDRDDFKAIMSYLRKGKDVDMYLGEVGFQLASAVVRRRLVAFTPKKAGEIWSRWNNYQRIQFRQRLVRDLAEALGDPHKGLFPWIGTEHFLEMLEEDLREWLAWEDGVRLALLRGYLRDPPHDRDNMLMLGIKKRKKATPSAAVAAKPKPKDRRPAAKPETNDKKCGVPGKPACPPLLLKGKDSAKTPTSKPATKKPASAARPAVPASSPVVTKDGFVKY